MSTQPQGPLHLQRYLTVCTESLEKMLRSTVEHPLTSVCSLYCRCGASGKLPLAGKSKKSNTPANSVEARTAEVRKRQVETASGALLPAVTGPGPAVPPSPTVPGSEDDRRATCRFFAIKLNDEEAVIHAYCRRCENKILVYDRVLYWGIKRASQSGAETFPYRCTCGSHAFEVAIGFDYPDEAIDENDINTITVAVRCVTCGTDAIIFDDEAT